MYQDLSASKQVIFGKPLISLPDKWLVEMITSHEGHQKIASSSNSSEDLHVCSVKSHWWNQLDMQLVQAKLPCYKQGRLPVLTFSCLFHQMTPMHDLCC